MYKEKRNCTLGQVFQPKTEAFPPLHELAHWLAHADQTIDQSIIAPKKVSIYQIQETNRPPAPPCPCSVPTREVSRQAATARAVAIPCSTIRCVHGGTDRGRRD